jgi:exopolyphosphatase/guanosine-5'-triphosphate,3'-diphosphate pyrophosphatase
VTRVAAIDCGTNSIRLLVADADGGGLVDVHREMRVVRLGQGVDRTGVLDPVALRRTSAALTDYARAAEDLGVEAVRMVATSATRDASNRQDFVASCRLILGVEPEVVTGAEEATLSFRGATSRLDLPAPYVVVDIGGGSTEVVLGYASVEASRSVDIGCVRLTERCLLGDPPTPDEVRAAEELVEDALDDVASAVDVSSARTFVGVAGSVTTVAAVALGLPAYDPSRIHGSSVPYADVERVTADLLAATRQRRAAMPVMHPGRVDVIGGGALVLRAIMRRWSLPAVVASEHDILDGIALSLLH